MCFLRAFAPWPSNEKHQGCESVAEWKSGIAAERWTTPYALTGNSNQTLSLVVETHLQVNHTEDLKLDQRDWKWAWGVGNKRDNWTRESQSVAAEHTRSTSFLQLKNNAVFYPSILAWEMVNQFERLTNALQKRSKSDHRESTLHGKPGTIDLQSLFSITNKSNTPQTAGSPSWKGAQYVLLAIKSCPCHPGW